MPAPSHSDGMTAPSGRSLMAPFAAPAAGVPLLCQDNALYSVSAGGTVRQMSGSTVTTIGSWSRVGNVNGLAIAAGGTAAYAYERAGNTAQNVSSILRYTPAANSWESLPNTQYTTNNSRALVAGAVNLATGHYLFGGFHDMGATLVFRLYDFDPATGAIVYVGYFDTELGTTVDANGDMAFDAAGNLYVVRSGTKINIFSVTAATLTNALASPGNQMNSSASAAFELSSFTQVNGIAFNTDGRVFLGNDDTVRKYDATTWTSTSTVTTSLSDSTDLASCNSPANVTVRKNVAGRAASTDQFTMTLKNGSTTVASATTSGTASGLQPQQIGPVPVPAGTALSITETAASGSLAAYTTTWSCSNGASGSGTSIGVTSPGAGGSLTCTFTNSPLVGSLQISKVVAGGGVAPTTPFRIAYDCGPGFVGTVDVTTAAPVVVGGIPNGRSCTTTEDKTQLTASKLIDASFSWVIAQSGVVAPAGAQTIVTNNTTSFTVTNTTTRNYGSITITKALAGGITTSDLVTGAAFEGTWTCRYPEATVVAAGSWKVTGAGAAALTATTGSLATIPLTSVCSVAEATPSSALFRDASWSWASSVVSPAQATVAAGAPTAFTVTNTAQRGSLTLVKKVDNSKGGSAVPTDWNQKLTAQRNGTTFAFDTGEKKYLVAGEYALAELGQVTGYQLTGITCGTDPAAVTKVAVPANGNVTCTFTNTSIAPTLTLKKVVDNANGGPSDTNPWTLTGAGPQTISGTSGAASVTDAVVLPGDYTLSENGPTSGYAASDWSCTGGTLSGAKVTVPLGGKVVCTITNVSQPGTATWTKTGPGGEPLGGSVWTLTGPGANGPATDVADCVQSPCAGPDSDPAAGAFTVTALTWGTYTLVERSAPIGYLLDPAPHAFAIDATNAGTVLAVGAFVNTPVVPPSLPLTGGLGRDAYVLGGLALLALGAVVVGLRRLRRIRRS